MPLSIDQPGVYFEEASVIGADIELVPTTVAAFIGYTGSTRLDLVRLTSLTEFLTQFGGPNPYWKVTIAQNAAPTLSHEKKGSTTELIPNFTLYYALQLYFANGGRECFVASVGPYHCDLATAAADFEAALMRVGNQPEVTLIIVPDLRLLKAVDAYRLYDNALAQSAQLDNRFTILDVHAATSTVVAGTNDVRNGIGTSNLSYGACYFPDLVVNSAYPDEAIFFDEAGGTTFPDIDSKTLAEAKVAALADTSGATMAQLIQVLPQVEALMASQELILPPGAAVAGAFVQNDLRYGVWMAPANIGLVDVLRPVIAIADTQQQSLNLDAVAGKSIDAIRTFAGKGILIWGARTLAGNSSDWRYISVRRLDILIRQSIQQGLQALVFEPNVEETWIRVDALVTNFLTNLWREGALMGAKPSDGFVVTIGLGSTMTIDDLRTGCLRLQIGYAPILPAEFITVNFEFQLSQQEI